MNLVQPKMLYIQKLKNFNLIFGFVITFTFLGCSLTKPIVYSYNTKVSNSILSKLNTNDSKDFFGNGFEKYLWVELTVQNFELEVIFRNYGDYPKNHPVRSLIKRTNRYLKLGTREYPIIFSTDNEYNAMTGTNVYYLKRGLVIKVDINGEIKLSGFAY